MLLRTFALTVVNIFFLLSKIQSNQRPECSPINSTAVIDITQDGSPVDVTRYNFTRTECTGSSSTLQTGTQTFRYNLTITDNFVTYSGNVLQISWHYKHYYHILHAYVFRMEVRQLPDVYSVCFTISGIPQRDNTWVHLRMKSDCFGNKFSFLKLFLYTTQRTLLAKSGFTWKPGSVQECKEWNPDIYYVVNGSSIITIITVTTATLPARVELRSREDKVLQEPKEIANTENITEYRFEFTGVPCGTDYRIVVHSKARRYDRCRPKGKRHVNVQHSCPLTTTTTTTSPQPPDVPIWVQDNWWILVTALSVIIVTALSVMIFVTVKRRQNRHAHDNTAQLSRKNNTSEPLDIEVRNINSTSVALLALNGSLMNLGNDVIDTFRQLIEEGSHFNVTNCSSQEAQQQLYANTENFVKDLINTCNTMVVLVMYSSSQETVSVSPSAEAFLTTYGEQGQNFSRFILLNLGTGEDCKRFFESRYRIEVDKVYNVNQRNLSGFSDICEKFLRDLGSVSHIEPNVDINQYYLIKTLHGHLFP